MCVDVVKQDNRRLFVVSGLDANAQMSVRFVLFTRSDVTATGERATVLTNLEVVGGAQLAKYGVRFV